MPTASNRALSGQTAENASLARAQALLGPTVNSISFAEFDNDQWHGSAVAGTGTVALTTLRSGVVQLDSGATGGSQALLFPHGVSATAGAHVGNMQTDLWYLRFRVKFPTAMDGATDSAVWMAAAVNGGSPFTRARLGAIGGTSTAFFSGDVATSAGGVSTFISSVAIDTNWHTFEIWNDRTNVQFAIDGIVVGTKATSLMSSSRGVPFAWATNGATAASRQVQIDSIASCFAGN